VIWWLRRDLRLSENLTLATAQNHGLVLPVFVLDPKLMDENPNRRQRFLFNVLKSLRMDLQEIGSNLIIRRGKPMKVLSDILKESNAHRIFAEEDFTPYAIRRDEEIARQLPLNLVQGQLLLHPDSVKKADGTPYTVYTPFSKQWKSQLPEMKKPIYQAHQFETTVRIHSEQIPDYPEESMFPASESQARDRLKTFLSDRIFDYAENRNRLDFDGTSLISPYLHFGILSLPGVIREAMQAFSNSGDQRSRKSCQTWLNELIWREFYVYILYHYPHVVRKSFRSQYDTIQWVNDTHDFEAWKNGRTGYPVVDAAMRQMLECGWMHNRARMIVASFLVKDLLIDWRWGERFFMEKLLDGDLAANNGGWQWTAGTGTDAAPYFRIFNPILQSKKFDPLGKYIRKWVPELAHLGREVIHAPWEKNVRGLGYPEPIIDHKYARERTLAAYQAVKG
jgi:deoxyribodipyrimidine photo-lyase